MTLVALVLALVALAAIAALFVALVLWARRAGARVEAQLGIEREALTSERAALEARLEAERRELELERQELETRRRKPHVGRLCLVNTPLPDDQTLRGVVRETYEDGSLLLGAAHHLAHDGSAIAAGDVYVPRASWVQVDVAPTETAARDE